MVRFGSGSTHHRVTRPYPVFDVVAGVLELVPGLVVQRGVVLVQAEGHVLQVNAVLLMMSHDLFPVHTQGT